MFLYYLISVSCIITWYISRYLMRSAGILLHFFQPLIWIRLSYSDINYALVNIACNGDLCPCLHCVWAFSMIFIVVSVHAYSIFALFNRPLLCCTSASCSVGLHVPCINVKFVQKAWGMQDRLALLGVESYPRPNNFNISGGVVVLINFVGGLVVG